MDNIIKELLGNVEIDFHKRLQEVETKIKKQMDELEKQKLAMEQAKEEQKFILEISEKLNKTTVPLHKKIKLNVGGTTFATALETLVSEKPTYFSAMFSEQFNTQPDEDGKIMRHQITIF